MSTGQCDSHPLRRARALTEAVAAVGAELRLVDVVDYVTFIRHDQLANLQDIVSSSIELYFKPGTLTFGWTAGFDLEWESPPTIVLGMEFRNGGAWIVFDLILRAEDTKVAIRHIVLSDAQTTPAAETDQLIAAIEDARLSEP